MKNLYVFFDTVSGNYGDVFLAENDLVVRRSAVRALASFSPEIARDTIVLCLGTIAIDDNDLPAIHPCLAVRTVFSGSSPEVEEVRFQLMEESKRYASFSGGDANAE